MRSELEMIETPDFYEFKLRDSKFNIVKVLAPNIFTEKQAESNIKTESNLIIKFNKNDFSLNTFNLNLKDINNDLNFKVNIKYDKINNIDVNKIKEAEKTFKDREKNKN